MGRSTPQSHAKRKREQLKKDKRRAKDEKRAARKAERQSETEKAGSSGVPLNDE
jgi:hypothetical protein